jgi:hypothetical protein
LENCTPDAPTNVKKKSLNHVQCSKAARFGCTEAATTARPEKLRLRLRMELPPISSKSFRKIPDPKTLVNEIDNQDNSFDTG